MRKRSLRSRVRRLFSFGSKYIWLNNPKRTIKIHKVQKEYLRSSRVSQLDTVVIFFVPGFDVVNGGIISLVSMCKSTQKLIKNPKTGVFSCTIPGEPPLLEFTQFKNEQTVVDFSSLLKQLKPGTKVLCHVPEIYLTRFLLFGKRRLVQKKSDLKFCFNILLQNIDFEPPSNVIKQLQALGPTTCTTAHLRYATKKTEERLGVPLHHLSAWANIGGYIRKAYKDKRNLIIISPDEHKDRAKVLAVLKSHLPEYELQVISNLTYEQYLNVIADAKFSITFGEGLDGYFSEIVYSGGLDVQFLTIVFSLTTFVSYHFCFQVGII